MKRIDIEQRSAEWLKLRKSHIGASEASSIMKLNPWCSPHQLWRRKIGLDSEQPLTKAMEEGIRIEPLALQAFNEYIDSELIPCVFKHSTIDYMMASLDGISQDNQTLVEIKCGVKSYEAAKAGIVPNYYNAQIQHQLEVCELEMAYYFCFDGYNGISLKVYRDDKFIKDMLEKERIFWDCIQNFESPEPQIKQIENEEWSNAVEFLSYVKEKKHFFDKEVEIARNRLIELCNGENTQGSGIQVTKHVRKSPINYSAIPELKGVDLEQFRNVPQEYWRIVEK